MQNVLRYLMMLRHIPREPQKIDVRTLRQRLIEHGIDVSVRTIQRNLNELSEVFPITTDERSKPYGWSLAQGAQQAPLIHLTEIPRQGTVTAIKLKCASNLSSLIKNNPVHPKQHIDEYGSFFVLSLEMPITNELVSWILSLGLQAEVLEPQQLRREVESTLRRMHARYNGDT